MNRQHVNVSRGEQIYSYYFHLVIKMISSTVMLQINLKETFDISSHLFLSVVVEHRRQDKTFSICVKL